MNMLTNLKIGTRLALGFSLVMLLSFLTTSIAMWRLHDVAQETRTMMHEPLAKERYISDWYRVIQAAVRRTAAIAKSSDASLTKFFADDAAATSKLATDMQNKVESLLVTDEEKKLFAAVGEKRKAYIAAREAVVKAKNEGQLDQANKLLEDQFMPAAASYQQLVQDLLDNQRKHIDASAAKIEADYQSGSKTLIAIAVLSLCLGTLAAYVLVAGILRQLGCEPKYAVDIANSIATGDLSVPVSVKAGDTTSLLYSMKMMRDRLSGIVTQVRSGTEAIVSASNQIAAGNQDLSSRTEQEASSLEETAASMEELSGTVKQNAEHAAQAKALAQVTSDVALRGGEVVSQVVTRMDSINHSAQKIADIITVIDGIAFQTNILALNAAVEAARAGEQGRGFAVVASEVRALAQRSASAAKEIKELINTSVREVAAGSALVDQAGTTMEEVVESVKKVSNLVAEIAEASAEQSSGISQVHQAVSQMDQVTQQNATLVEESASAATSLQEQARLLDEIVRQFKVDSVSTPTATEITVPRAQAIKPVKLAPKQGVRPNTRMVANGVPIATEEWEQF